MESLYFAYGSNLSIEQMVQRIGEFPREPGDLRIARLAGYRLAFHSLDEGEPAYADIVALKEDAPGEGALGVVYRCDESALRRLDVFEKSYARITVEVVAESGERLSVFAYAMLPSPTLRSGTPSAEYLARIVDGARQHGLPEAYVENVLAIARQS